MSLLMLGELAAMGGESEQCRDVSVEASEHYGEEQASGINGTVQQLHTTASQEGGENNTMTVMAPTIAPTDHDHALTTRAEAAASEPSEAGTTAAATSLAEADMAAAAAATSVPQHLLTETGALPAEVEAAVSLGDCVALETLLRRAATLTGASDALGSVTVWLDSWEGRMQELCKTLAVDVFGGRWRRNLEEAVEAWDGGSCVGLLQMIDLLPE